MAKLWQFLKGHPKPAFSGNVQRVDQRKFFKNRPKSGPRLKALWRKWQYPLISMHLRCNDLGRFWSKKVAPKCQNGQVMAIFARSPKTRIFQEKCKRGTKGNVSQIAANVALVLKAQTHSFANGISFD